jgi:radical SAM-linked protein
LAESKRRLGLAQASIGDRRVKAKWNSPEQSLLEGVLSRGDRRLSRALELAMAKGCRFDGWSEELNLEAWLAALAEAGLSPEEYLRPRELDEALPWDHIDVGVTKAFLLTERERARAGEASGDCRSGRCLNCGVCDHKLVKPRLAAGWVTSPPRPAPPADGERPAYRFRLEKTGSARFLGHLEMMGQLQRAFRRAGVELAHSQGFHPHPLLKSASALPLGVESLVEVLEATLVGHWPSDRLCERLNATLPQGLRVHNARPARPGESLAEPEEVTYLVRSGELLDPAALARFQAADSLTLVRETPKGRREMDLKAAIRAMELMDDDSLTVVVGQAGGRPKPAEVLQAVFGLSPEAAQSARAVKIAAGRS